MTAGKEEWEQFCLKAAAVMRDATDNKISLEKASLFFERDKAVSNPHLRRYLEYIIFEIDGIPDFYPEVVKLFESRTTEDEFVRSLRL